MSMRYFFYLVLVNMVASVMVYVPNILIAHRFHGAIMSMVLAVPLSTLLAYLFAKGLIKFPGMGLPEIFNLALVKWVRNPLLVYLGISCSIGTWLVLSSFVFMAKQYINPDMSMLFTLLFFMAIAGLGALKGSRTVMYILEIISLLITPFVILIIVKALLSPYLRWKEVMAMGAYAFTWPTWGSLAAATFLLSGYLEMVVLHRVFGGEFKTKYHWFLPIIGFFGLFIMFVIPIGFHGSAAVADYSYPWLATADSIRFRLGFIERVIFVYFLVYISMTLVFGIVSWHNAFELIKGVFSKTKLARWQNYFPWIVLGFFFIPPICAVEWLDQPKILLISALWLKIRLVGELAIVMLVYLLGRRRKLG